MSGRNANRVRSDEWRQERSRLRQNLEYAQVRNRRKSKLSGKRHIKVSYIPA